MLTMSYPLKNMGFPVFPPFNFVHAGIMYQNKMFSKDRKNGHMIFNYCPLKKDYADTIVEKQAVKNGFLAFPAFPPFSFVHAGTTYQNIKFNKDEKNGYMIFDYCPLKKDLANTIVQEPAVENDELQKKMFELTEEVNELKHRETIIKEQLAKLLDDAESIKTQLIKKNDELQNKMFELTEEVNVLKHKEAIVKEQLAELLDEESKKNSNGLLVEENNLRENGVLATGVQPKRRTIWCRIKKSLRRMICCA